MRRFAFYIVPFLLSICSCNCFSQEDINKINRNVIAITGGVGVPELINVGLRYGGHTKIGIVTGIWPRLTGNPSASLSLEFYQVISESKKRENVLWYFNTGFSKAYYSFPDPLANLICTVRAERLHQYSQRNAGAISFGGMFLFMSRADANPSYSVLFLPSVSFSFNTILGRRTGTPQTK